jgi:hypothetical protein
MAVGAEQVRALALGLPGVSEAAHWHRVAFRTPRRIFATLDAVAGDLNLMFDQDLRDFYCELAPSAFSPVPGGWGRRGATCCLLAAVEEGLLVSALRAAHALAAPLGRRRVQRRG